MATNKKQDKRSAEKQSKWPLFIIITVFLATASLTTIIPMNAAYAETVSNTIQLRQDGVGVYPTAVNPNTNMIYVANVKNGLIFVIDGNANEVVTSIQVPYDPPSVVPLKITVDSINNKMYVADNWGGLIVIDGATNAISQTVSFNSSSVFSAAVNPVTNKIYVINPPYVSVLDASTYEVIRTISIPDSGSMRDIAVNPVTNMIYVGGTGSAYSFNTVAMIDGSTDQFVSKTEFCRAVGLAINTQTNTVYAASAYDGNVCVIDGSTNTITDTIELATYQSAIDVNPNLNRVYIHVYYTNEITVIDGNTNSIIETIPVGSNPLGLAVNPDTDLLYVADHDLGALSVLDLSSTPISSTTSLLSVSSQDASGNEITGYYTVLFQNGAVQKTGFTPATFTLTNNEQYTVEVQDYGQYVFDHWADSASTARDRQISISSDTGITAIYRNANSPPLEQPADEEPLSEEEEPPAPQEDSSVIVRSIDKSSGNEIFGYYTTLFDSSGNVIQTGFTPVTFELVSGQTYTVAVQDYGSYFFNHWMDNNSQTRERTITAGDGEMVLTAGYGSSAPAPQPEPEPEPEPTPEPSSTISVTTVDSSGSQIFGYWTVLWQNGQVVQTGFSPIEFDAVTGQSYQVSVGDYGSYVFDHWSADGSTTRLHDAEAGDSLVAVYRP